MGIHQGVDVERMSGAHLPRVADLIRRQEARWHGLDARLSAPHEGEQIGRVIEGASIEPGVCSLVAVAGGEVLGCAMGEVRALPPDSEGLTFMGARDGAMRLLALPGEDEPRREVVAEALLSSMQEWWDEQETTGVNLTRPVCEKWVWHLLERRGWMWVSVTALRPAGALPPSSRVPIEGLVVRQVRREDEDAVAALHVEEYKFHEGYDPTVRVVPAVETEIRGILTRIWEKESKPEADRMERQAFVVEYRGEAVAASIAYMYIIEANGSADLRGRWALKPGRYCHIGSTGVRADMRGKGVGRALVEGITHFYEPLGVQAYSLTYHLRNPLSNAFWPRLGWVPVTGRYVKGERYGASAE